MELPIITCQFPDASDFGSRDIQMNKPAIGEFIWYKKFTFVVVSITHVGTEMICKLDFKQNTH